MKIFCYVSIAILFIILIHTTATYSQAASLTRLQVEQFTFGGPYASVMHGVFDGGGFYANGDSAKINYTFPSTGGVFRFELRGASSNSNAASISLYVDSLHKNVIFTGATPILQSVSFTLPAQAAPREVKLLIETDIGTYDTFVDYIDIFYDGAASSPLPNPTPATIGAFQTGNYRNLFKEWGKSDIEITTKLQAAWNSLFYGTNDGNKDNPANQAVYKTVGSDAAYVEDIHNGDIRSEGMSYAMMIAVQLNKQAEFDRLWKFAKTYMLCPHTTQCPVGSGLEGYFSWQVSPVAPFTAIDPGPAPDGEEYIATALIFAAGRWGIGGQFNYAADALAILNAMLTDNRANGLHGMFDPAKKVVVFSPNGTATQYSDPSYHLPAFYEIWAQFDSNPTQRIFWHDVANQSRAYWKVASGSNSGRTNGLMPDCTDLIGNATYGCAGGAIYAYDSWRTISNVAIDYAWWAADNWEKTETDRLQSFFGSKRPSYMNQWNMDGTAANGQMDSTGQIAMNAVAGLSGSTSYVWDFTEDLWNLSIPTGRYRYYDGLLYMMALLHLSGNFKAYMPGVITPTPQPSPQPTFDLVTDSKINSLDFGFIYALLGSFSGQMNFDTRADYDQNGSITVTDMTELIKAYH